MQAHLPTKPPPPALKKFMWSPMPGQSHLARSLLALGVITISNQPIALQAITSAKKWSGHERMDCMATPSLVIHTMQ